MRGTEQFQRAGHWSLRDHGTCCPGATAGRRLCWLHCGPTFLTVPIWLWRAPLQCRRAKTANFCGVCAVQFPPACRVHGQGTGVWLVPPRFQHTGGLAGPHAPDPNWKQLRRHLAELWGWHCHSMAHGTATGLNELQLHIATGLSHKKR